MVSIYPPRTTQGASEADATAKRLAALDEAHKAGALSDEMYAKARARSVG